MQKTITLEFADNEFSLAHDAVLQAGFDIDEYLNFVVKAIANQTPGEEDVIERVFHILPDETVLSLANARINSRRSREYSRLLEKKKVQKLSQSESNRLVDLAKEYECGTLRKAYAMAEAVRRGLIPPVQP